MTARHLVLAVVLSACAAACARVDRADLPSDDVALERQLLVMLRAAPPHFRPDVNYAGSYDARTGRDARRRIAEGVASQYDLRIVHSWPMPALGVDCFVMAAPGDDAIARIVDRMSLDPRVESVQAMNVFHVLAHDDPLYSLQPSATLWHLADLHRITTGRRVRVAEVDTGVEMDHPDLLGRVALTRDFVERGAGNAEDHGTAVAGIIAARPDDGVGIAGIAPDASLIALRACWQAGGRGLAAVCSSFTLAKALQFALDERVDVINLSVGGPRDRLLERLLDIALARGITVVGAVDAEVRDGGFPASHRGVLAVAADDAHDIPDNALPGPGRDIPTTITGHKWGFVTGSSFAAAHVTGLVALLRELAPNMSPQQMHDTLAPQSISRTAAGRRVTIDACAAVAAISGTCACACAVAGDTKSPPAR